MHSLLAARRHAGLAAGRQFPSHCRSAPNRLRAISYVKFTHALFAGRSPPRGARGWSSIPESLVAPLQTATVSFSWPLFTAPAALGSARGRPPTPPRENRARRGPRPRRSCLLFRGQPLLWM